jgi:hypothetical protein
LTIDVVIHDPNIKRVELFAGERCATDCPVSTVAPGLPPLRVDHAFVVIDPKPFTVADSDFSDGVAGFRLESSVDVELPILVIVAYDAQDELRWSWSRRGVAIPDADAERWEIHLDDTAVIAPLVDTQPAGTERHKLWPAPNGLPSCLLLEHWGHSSVERELLGPHDDPDCDGVAAAIECAPWIPNAVATAPPVEETTCVLPRQLADGVSVCVLGGPQCSESPGQPSDACVAANETYCTPQLLCLCSGMPNVRDCLRARIADGMGNATMPHVKCVIPINDAGAACAGSFMLNASNALVGSTRKCTGMRLNELEVPLGSFQNYLHLGNGKLKLDSFSEPCTGQLSWESGGMPPPTDNLAVLDVELDNGNHLAFPMRVDFKPGCTTNAMAICQVVSSSDSMFQCVQPMQPVGACPPSGGLCTEGVMCEGVCCGPGEMCTPTGCKCGVGPRCNNTAGDFCVSRFGGYDHCGELCCGSQTNLCPF